MLNDFLSLFLGAYDSLIGRVLRMVSIEGCSRRCCSRLASCFLWLACGVVIRALASWSFQVT